MSGQEFLPFGRPPSRPLARASDPDTSREAAAAIQDALPGERERALGLVRWHPNHTATELAHIAGDSDPRRINRRISELLDAGLIYRAEKRRCEHTDRNAWTYLARER